jgi:hypothetical protein
MRNSPYIQNYIEVSPTTCNYFASYPLLSDTQGNGRRINARTLVICRHSAGPDIGYIYIYARIYSEQSRQTENVMVHYFTDDHHAMK